MPALVPTFGPSLTSSGARFSLWAPAVDAVTLLLEHSDGSTAEEPLANEPDGWHGLDVRGARAGDRYRFLLPDGMRVPDPASHFNPDDVHGASQLIDGNHQWLNDGWRGLPWAEAVLYELHVGAFTPEGTFKAAQARLAELKAIGVTAIGLMPVADFPGKRSWGYDGVLQFAPDAAYGTPRELREFIDAAHGHGLMVTLDVVYNHFGPEGNYLPAYCPQFFNPAHQTPWGAAINFDGEHSQHVRAFFVQNALYWIEAFRFDGLRMDAVHAIRDDSDISIVQEICAAVRAGPGATRHVHIVLENEHNSASMLERAADGEPMFATAQWNDDIHHAVHVLATEEIEGYYADYQQSPVELLARSLAEGFIFQGQASDFLKGKHRGEPSGHLPGGAFVSFLQTHDQVGNRALGERIHAIGDPVILGAARACILLSPHVPMLFMGEEYAASTPFQFFCDFGPELAGAVTEGRRREFSHFGGFADGDGASRVPDPNAESTFMASKLDWNERGWPPHAKWLTGTMKLLALRREHIVPLLPSQRGGGRFSVSEGGTLQVEWDFEPPGASNVRLYMTAHLGTSRSSARDPSPGREVLSMGVTRNAGSMLFERGAVYVSLQETTRG